MKTGPVTKAFKTLARLTAVLLLASAAGLSTAAIGDEPSKEPILRIETGVHTAAIKRIATDRQNRFLVTASVDKTLRVWDLATGRPLSVIRPPIGQGNEGMLFAVAMSPDGETIACGGWSETNSLYIFSRATGRMLLRIAGLPNVINNLEYSPDGRFLAASLWEGGVMVWNTGDYSPAGKDDDYGSGSYSVDFDASDRIVTTCYDGFIRLYAPPGTAGPQELQLLAKRQAPGGSRPFRAVFSPDATKIAVGFDDSTRVNVLSATDLGLLYEPETDGITNGAMSAVTFSEDGSTLYAGGTFSVEGWDQIRRWAAAGRGRYADAPACRDIVSQIVPLRKGGVVYGSGYPSFGTLDAPGMDSVRMNNAKADVRGNWEGFQVSWDGYKVKFGFEEWGESPAVFDIANRELLLDNLPQNLTSPVFSSGSINLASWKYFTNPTVNGKAISLAKYERSVSVAVAPDNHSFLLGADWNLYRFDENGAETWETTIPGIAWAVNISGDGKLAVAALGDGTLRWYDYSNGRELLAFFPHADKKRWVLWSPSGYYDCSQGGEDLIGWHVNNGYDSAADFFGASRFRAAFYRPDVMARVLEARDEKEALRLADAETGRKAREADVSRLLPPVVTILSPRDGAEVSAREITLKVGVRTPSGEPVTAIKAFVDGRPAESERGLAVTPTGDASSPEREIRVTVPERDCVVTVIAENRYTASEPAATRIHWAGAAPEPEFTAKPVLYVLAIGVSDYADKSISLKYPAKDARDLAAAFSGQRGLLYRDVVAKVLTDADASKEGVLDGLDWIERQTTSHDLAVVFIAGHGVNDRSGIYYFLPHNADPERLKATCVPFSDIKNTISALAGKVICFVDTCHAGDVMGGRRGMDDINAVVNELSSAENGAVVFASSTGRQYSLENDEWGNGAFTKALVEGLSGKAAYQGGRITVNMLDLYVSERVKALTGGRQTPATTKPSTVPDFPVALTK